MTRRSKVAQIDHAVEEKAVSLQVRTKSPTKYLLIDTETGFIGRGASPSEIEQSPYGTCWVRTMDKQRLQEAAALIQAALVLKEEGVVS